MNCDTFHPLISRDIDGRIGPEEEAALRGHLAACVPCREERDAQHRLRRVLSDLPRPVAPDGLADRIADRVLEKAPTGRLVFRRWSPGLKAAAVLLVAGLSFVGGRVSSSPGIGATVTPEGLALSKFQQQLGDQERLLLREVGLTPEDTRRVLDIRLRHKTRSLFDGSGAAQERFDREKAEILQTLSPEGRALYWRHFGDTEEELDRLLRLPLPR